MSQAGAKQQLRQYSNADQQYCEKLPEAIALERMEQHVPNRQREKQIEGNVEKQKEREESDLRMASQPDKTARQYEDHFRSRGESQQHFNSE